MYASNSLRIILFIPDKLEAKVGATHLIEANSYKSSRATIGRGNIACNHFMQPPAATSSSSSGVSSDRSDWKALARSQERKDDQQPEPGLPLPHVAPPTPVHACRYRDIRRVTGEDGVFFIYPSTSTDKGQI